MTLRIGDYVEIRENAKMSSGFRADFGHEGAYTARIVDLPDADGDLFVTTDIDGEGGRYVHESFVSAVCRESGPEVRETDA